MQVRGSTDGLPSDPLPVLVASIQRAFGYLSLEQSYNNSGAGFESDYRYILYDNAGFPINVPITLHETLENCQPYSGSNWCSFPKRPGTWYPNMWNNGEFVDRYTAEAGQGLSPEALVPQNPPGAAKMLDITQKFFVGAPGDPNNLTNVFTGMCVQRNRVQMYRDHGVKDNVTSPVSAALCAPGQFAN